MNIKEDRFTNKSADQIVKDVLLQHKNNTQDALAYIQNLTSNDGLSLSDETKNELKKAEDMLVNKAKRESLVEDLWPFKKKEEPKKYPAKLVCYPPFKKEPTVMQLPGITSLEDPFIDQALTLFRKKHPHSIIYLDSELGRKRFYENSIRDYKINAYDKEGNKKELYAGNLPLANALSKKLYESDLYENVDILQEDKVINSYNKKDSKPELSLEKEDDKYFYFKSKKNPNKLIKKAKKPSDKHDNDTFLDRTKKDLLNSPVVNNLATVGLSALTGISPVFLGGVTNTAKNYIQDKIANKNKYKQKLKDINQEFGIKEDLDATSDDVGSDDYIIPENDTANLTDNLYYILHGIHPSLADKRSPKIYWPDKYKSLLPSFEITIDKVKPVPDNTSYDRMPANLITGYDPNAESVKIPFVVKGIKLANQAAPKDNELKAELNNYLNADNIEEFKNKYISDDKDLIFLLPKFPVAFNGYSKKGKPLFQYKLGKSNQAIPVTVKDFKKIWNDGVNFENKEKFEKKHIESEDKLLNEYLTALEYLDNQYPSWESKYFEKYGLDRFDVVTRSKIYKDWKEKNASSMVKTSSELTRDEIDKKYYFPELLNKLKTINPTLGKQLENVVNRLQNNKDKQAEFTEKILDLFDNIDDKDINEALLKFYNDEASIYTVDSMFDPDMSKQIQNKEAELKNHDKLNHTNLYDQFKEEKNKIIKNSLFLLSIQGLGKVSVVDPKKINTLKIQIKELCNKYQGTKVDKFKQTTEKQKEIDSLNDEILNTLEKYTEDETVGGKAIISLLMMTNKLPQSVNKASNDNSNLTTKEAYLKKVLEFIKELEKEHSDMNDPEIADKINAFKDKIATETKYPHSSTNSSVKHYVTQAYKNRILNSTDEDDEEK